MNRPEGVRAARPQQVERESLADALIDKGLPWFLVVGGVLVVLLTVFEVGYQIGLAS